MKLVFLYSSILVFASSLAAEEKKIEEDLIRQKAAYLMDMIEAAELILSRKDYKAAHRMAEKLKEKIRRMRKCGLEKSGAYSPENLAFKVLRRNGYLAMLSDVKDRAYDGMYSYKAGGGIVVRVWWCMGIAMKLQTL